MTEPDLAKHELDQLRELIYGLQKVVGDHTRQIHKLEQLLSTFTDGADGIED